MEKVDREGKGDVTGITMLKEWFWRLWKTYQEEAEPKRKPPKGKRRSWQSTSKENQNV